MISIITPAPTVLPWHNARLINIFSQSFKDWEWVILDNSQDGCVKRYIEEFFDSEQGEPFLECKQKVNCVWEPFSGITLKQKRIGKLKNRCVELTTCKDDDFVFLLDFDDFIYDGFLDDVYTVSKTVPKCEFITGMLQQGVGQKMSDGMFVYSDSHLTWINQKYKDKIDLLRTDNEDFAEFEKYYLSDDFHEYKILRCNSSLKIKNIGGMEFSFDTITTLNENGYSFLGHVQHPYVFKKKPFLDKIGGFDTSSIVEDSICFKIPYALDGIVYLLKPCYIQCMMIGDDNMRIGGTMDICKAMDKELEKEGTEVFLKFMNEKLKVLKSYNKFIKPLFLK